MTVGTDDRLTDVPMRTVQCTNCTARVEVRKSSWQQTSIQWNQHALANCTELPQHAEQRRHCPIKGCAALRSAINEAAREGTIHVPDDGY